MNTTQQKKMKKKEAFKLAIFALHDASRNFRKKQMPEWQECDEAAEVLVHILKKKLGSNYCEECSGECESGDGLHFGEFGYDVVADDDNYNN